MADPPSRYVELSAEEWSRLAGSIPLALGEEELAALWSAPVPGLDLTETARAYLPLARLLHLQRVARQGLTTATEGLLGRPMAPTPLVVGLTGSVAVGKSTAARLLQALLAVGPGAPRVDLVATDGFLHPNAELERRGLLAHKGFPESYDLGRLLRFLAAVKAGAATAEAPVYSHVRHDVVPGSVQTVRRPDIVVVEGVNLLSAVGSGGLVASDLLDLTIYLDAEEADLRRWYLERFLALGATVLQDPAPHVHRTASAGPDEGVAVAQGIWASVNAVNLREHILPSRERAQLVVEKGPDHRVRRVRLRVP